MKRLLILTAMLLPIVFLNSPARTHEQEVPRPPQPLPNLADYPESGPYCRRRVTMDPWVGTPAVVFTKTFQCVMDYHTCEGVKTAVSEVKVVGRDTCKEFWDRHDQLTGRQICCDPKCEAGTPWFNPSPGCKDLQPPEVRVSDNRIFTYVYICGDLHFSFGPRESDAAYRKKLSDFVKSRIGSKVCCDTYRDSGRVGPCDASYDIDCDGKYWSSDTTSLDPSMPNSLPDINVFTQAAGSSIDPFPPGLDANDANFIPPGDKCDCKWELTKGTLTCSPDGKQKHVYQARWKCPSSGNERFTRKEAPATAPCTPPRRQVSRTDFGAVP